MLTREVWSRHPCQAALDLTHAVSADKVDRLTNAAGIYAIWREDMGPDRYPALLYVGSTRSTVGVRMRIERYLHRSRPRPNETLYLHIINHVVRPDLSKDDRAVAEIAVDFLQGCLFAGWGDDGSWPLSKLERAAFGWGVSGELPLLNEPGRRRLRGLASIPTSDDFN